METFFTGACAWLSAAAFGGLMGFSLFDEDDLLSFSTFFSALLPNIPPKPKPFLKRSIPLPVFTFFPSSGRTLVISLPNVDVGLPTFFMVATG